MSSHDKNQLNEYDLGASAPYSITERARNAGRIAGPWIALVCMLVGVLYLFAPPLEPATPFAVASFAAAGMFLLLPVGLRTVRDALVHPVMLLAALVAMAYSLVFVALSGDPAQTVVLVIILIGASGLLLSVWSTAVMVTLSIAVWILLSRDFAMPDRIHWIINLGSAGALAIVITNSRRLLMKQLVAETLTAVRAREIAENQAKQLGWEITERKRSEDAIRESEKRLTQIFDFLPDATFFIDREGKVQAWNRAMEEMTRIKSEEILGKTEYEYAIPFYGERRPLLADLAREWEEDLAGQFKSFHKKGDLLFAEQYHPLLGEDGIYVWTTACPIHDTTGKVTGVIESLRDITEQKEMEELRTRYDFIVNSVKDPMSFINREYVYEAVNDQWCSILQENRESAIGKTVAEIWGLETFEEKIRPNIDRCLGGEEVSYERLIDFGKLGERYCLTGMYPYFNEQKEVTHAVVVTSDITDRKEVEEEVLKSEEQYRSLFENANEGILVAQDGMLRLVNPQAESLFGFSAQELTSRPLADFIHPEDRAMVQDRHESRLKGEKLPDEYAFRIEDKKGQTRWIEIKVVVIQWEERPAALCFMTDITERKRAEEALQKRVKELAEMRVAMLNMMEDLEEEMRKAEEATQAKSTFLANMSHEIRTPMNAILGFLELVLEDTVLTEHHRKHLATAQVSASGLLGVINDILDISKLESGKLTIEQQPFSLFRLMQEIHKTMNMKAREKGLELQLDIQPSLSGSFVGDPLRLRQIMINLVGNAVKFTEKGRVSIRVMPAEEEGHLHVEIEDTGIGIPADRLSRIFETFTQADTSTTRRFGGTGLGTTISRELVELMGGRIWAESEIGKGSTFHFIVTMPPTDQVPEEADLLIVPDRAVLPGSRRGFRILLAEDIEANVELAKIRLKQQGHEVTVAWNGREAVEAFERGGIDLILMDIQMPEMSGMEATTRIRALEAGTGGHMPIIAMTAGVMREETEKYLEVGMDAVVAKPIDFGKLFKTMEDVIPEGVGEVVAEVEKDTSAPSGLELPSLDGVDIKKGIQTWQNPEAYAKALLGFSRDYGNIADKLSRLIAEGDMDGAYRMTHTLKGVAGNLSITEVADAITNIDVMLREKRMDDVKGQLPTLAAALNTAVDAIRQLEGVQAVEEMPKKEMDVQYMKELLIKMLAAFDQFNPYAIEPFLSEMKTYLSKDQLNPIVKHMERFDFDGAKQKTVKLAEMLKIDLL